mmetsp:Transcript_25305/g.42697  ORF Transcript_25305/g.42697 Transcript_25305/m.42697 type:complete len:301 (+) Transcript_25305:66-968(+)
MAAKKFPLATTLRPSSSSLVLLLVLLLASFFVIPTTAMSYQDNDKFIKSFAETSLLKSYISDYIAERAASAVTRHGSFVIALSGGSMPKLLSELAERADIPWERTFVLFADERCCALDDDDSNFKACREAFFHKVSLPAENIITIERYEEPDEAARLYEARLQEVLQGRPIDMVLLGLGPDGHTASLFPGHELLQYRGDRLVLPIFDSPKPPSRRITLTLGAINSSREVLFIATGAGKAQRLLEILSPASCTDEGVAAGPVVYPPSLVAAARVSWLIDNAAAELIQAHPHIEFITEKSCS